MHIFKNGSSIFTVNGQIVKYQFDFQVQLWLDASDASTVDLNGNSVSAWRDKSVYKRHATQSNAAAQPLYSYSSLQFNGNHFFNVDLDFLAGTSHSSFTVIQNTTYTNIYGAATGGLSANSLHIGFFNASQYRMNYWGNDYYPPISANYKVGQYNLINFDWINNSSKTARANRSVEGTLNQQGTIGTMAGGGRILNVVGQGIMTCNIKEMIFITGSTVTEENRAKIANYLTTKWGL